MKKLPIYTIIALLTIVRMSIAQPDQLWYETYGGGNNDWCRSHVQTPDGGFLLAGETNSFGNLGGSDLYLVRTDAEGQVIWANTFGTQHNDVCTDVALMSDGGFAVVGNYSNHDMDIYVAKISANGNLIWQSQAVSNDYDEAWSIIETTDGGVGIVGRTNSSNQFGGKTGNWDVVFFRWTANGGYMGFPDVSWSRMYGIANESAFGQDLVQTSDGGFAIVATRQPGDGPTADYWLIKTNANGDVEWTQTYGGDYADEVQALIQTADDGYAITGMTNSFGVNNQSSYLIKTNAQGQVIWENQYGGQNGVELGYSVIETIAGPNSEAGGLAIGGWNGRPMMRATDPNGNSLWSLSAPFDGQQNSGFGESITQSPDGEFALSGMVVGLGAGNQEFFLMQTGTPFDGYNDFVETQFDHTVLILAAEFDNSPVPTGWEIGIFTPGQVMAGGGVWIDGQQLGIPAFGDDDQTQVVEGFVEDEEMEFRIWDNNANVEYSTITIIDSGSIIWADGSATALSLFGYHIYTIDLTLAQNWNMISINVSPPPAYWTGNQGPNIPLMMAQFAGNLLMMKDEDGRFYWPAFNFCNIPFWNLQEGYKVKMSQQQQGSWTGAQIPASYDVPIEIGWNIIAYFPTYELHTGAGMQNPDFYVISPIAENVLIAKNSAGDFMLPQNNYSDMPVWRESQGYQIKVNAPVVLNYPENEPGTDFVEPMAEPSNNHWSQPSATGVNMSVLVTAINGISAQSGDQIAAYSANNAIVGVGVVDGGGMCGIAVWGDDVSTEEIDGLQNGEAFTLRLWNNSQNIESTLESNIQQGSLTYETDGFTNLTVNAVISVPENFYLSNSYPNPFNSTTRISFGLPEATHVSVSVFDMTGRLVATLAEGNLAAGNHAAVWNADNTPAGLYMVKMQAGTFSDVRKLTLVK